MAYRKSEFLERQSEFFNIFLTSQSVLDVSFHLHVVDDQCPTMDLVGHSVTLLKSILEQDAIL